MMKKRQSSAVQELLDGDVIREVDHQRRHSDVALLDGVDVRRLALVRVEDLAGDRVEDAPVLALLPKEGVLIVALALAAKDDLRAAVLAERIGANTGRGLSADGRAAMTRSSSSANSSAASSYEMVLSTSSDTANEEMSCSMPSIAAPTVPE